MKVMFRWIDKITMGLAQKDRVVISPLGALSGIYIHEILHQKYPKLSEEEIDTKTYYRLKRMTTKEVKNLGCRLLRQLLGGENNGR